MPNVTLLTGGARSGKSFYALKLASKYKRKAFIATAEVVDDEMKERVARHRADRGGEFLNIEEPLELGHALSTIPPGAEVVVIDCLTVWLGNLMHHIQAEADYYPPIDLFFEALSKPPCDVIIVTNEVGGGIVPADATSRHYRDLAGSLNQRAAALADDVIMIVCGLPVKLK